MESVELPRGIADDQDYRVTLLDEFEPDSRAWRIAAIGTAIVHAILILGLISIPPDLVETTARKPARRITPLIDPPTRLTQKAPNKAPVSTTISVGLVPPSPAVVPKPAARKKFEPPPPAQVVTKRNPAPSVPQEPPKILAAQQAPPQVVQPPLPQTLPQTPVRTVEAPKIMLESLPPAPTGQGAGKLKLPGGGVQDAVQELAKHGASPAKSIGDDVDSAPAPTFNLTPSPTRPKSNVELLSDPKGVDFRNYLLQVLQNVRRNWFAVMPESARLGERGRVVAEFSIAPNGEILKVVLTTESTARQLDRAAVAALSMSNPLPQLPPEFKGDRIILQFTFLYNAPR